MLRICLTEALLGAEDWEAARDAAMRALEDVRQCHRIYAEIEPLRALALSRAHIEGPSADGIESLLDAADALIERTHGRIMAPRVAEARAELAALRGDRDGHQTWLREAHRLYTRMGATGHADGLSAVGAGSLRVVLRGGPPALWRRVVSAPSGGIELAPTDEGSERCRPTSFSAV